MYSSHCFGETSCFHLYGRIIETAGPFEMLVPFSQTTWHHMPEDHNFNITTSFGIKAFMRVGFQVMFLDL